MGLFVLMRQLINMLPSELRKELDAILNYWIKYTSDDVYGGFVGKVTSNDEQIVGADRGLVLYARILWSFSRAHRFDAVPAYKEMAEKAYHYLWANFWDKKYGGAYWSVDYLGNPKNKNKQFYGQGFLLYGLTEYYSAFNDSEALNRAITVYKTIEKYGSDPLNDGYFEVADQHWNLIADNVITNGTAKSMNTHLHIIEPYTSLLKVWPNTDLQQRVESLSRIFLEKILNKETYTLHLFFDSDWTPLSQIVSFGHDIEASWLLYEAAEVLDDDDLLQEIKEVTLKMAYNSLHNLDTDGGMFNERQGIILNSEKHWWIQTEAMIGFFNAYQLSGDERFLNAVWRVWSFIKKRLITDSGEWIWGINEKNEPMLTEDKVGIWKCPYHNVRALIEVLERLSP